MHNKQLICKGVIARSPPLNMVLVFMTNKKPLVAQAKGFWNKPGEF
jgi:hypothetical protein